jgi:hypothetical protein
LFFLVDCLLLLCFEDRLYYIKPTSPIRIFFHKIHQANCYI